VLTRPPGVILDLNGVVKGLAVDEASRLIAHGFVSAGGDIAVKTSTDVGLPDGSSVRVTDGGLATSGTTKRRWTRGGTLRHHLIDPATGRPAAPGPLGVTVVAATTAEAEIHATALAITPVEQSRTYLMQHPKVAALVVPPADPPFICGRIPLVERNAEVVEAA
jgi:thiamine biosynthesis lipoprotein